MEPSQWTNNGHFVLTETDLCGGGTNRSFIISSSEIGLDALRKVEQENHQQQHPHDDHRHHDGHPKSPTESQSQHHGQKGAHGDHSHHDGQGVKGSGEDHNAKHPKAPHDDRQKDADQDHGKSITKQMNIVSFGKMMEACSEYEKTNVDHKLIELFVGITKRFDGDYNQLYIFFEERLLVKTMPYPYK